MTPRWFISSLICVTAIPNNSTKNKSTHRQGALEVQSGGQGRTHWCTRAMRNSVLKVPSTPTRRERVFRKLRWLGGDDRARASTIPSPQGWPRPHATPRYLFVLPVLSARAERARAPSG